MSSDPGSRPESIPLLRSVSIEALVRVACGATLLSLALMGWSVIDPTPLPVMVSMSVGQVVGTFALACYLLAVLLHQLRVRRARGSSTPP